MPIDICKHGNQINAICADCDDEAYHEEQDNKATKRRKNESVLTNT